MPQSQNIYDHLKSALQLQINANQLSDVPISVRCQALTAEQAIGNPEDQDYPIIRGKESIVEAEFLGAKGHAFSDTYGDSDYTLGQLVEMPLTNNRQRADFIAALNAVYRHLGICDKTVHCQNNEPQDCAQKSVALFTPGANILLIGLQPRFLEHLSMNNTVRCVDLDADNIGKEKYGVTIESPDMTKDALDWCDVIFATGSTLVNGTLTMFLDSDKPVIFYGVTVAAAAEILNIPRYCEYGH